MARRTNFLVAAVCFTLLFLAGASAAHARDRSLLRAASKQGPTIEGELSFGTPSLSASYRTALRKLHYVDSCQALFTRLGADGIEVLQNTTYTMATSDWQKRLCQDAEAFTTVGGSQVWLCAGFAWMSESEAARVLLHEALHNAGLGEQPNDPDAPTPDQIEEMVKRDCRF